MIFDVGPDIRQQLITNHIFDIEKAIISHRHSDHIIGLWELHVFNKYFDKNINLYIKKEDKDHIDKVFGFCINKFNNKLIEHNMKIDDLFFQEQQHGEIKNLSIRYQDIVYANDFSSILNEEIFYDSKMIFLDCANWHSTYAHVGFDFIDSMMKFNAKKIYLINLSHKLDFQELKIKIRNKFQSRITPAYDSMIIDI